MTFTLNLAGLAASVEQIEKGAEEGARLGAEHVLSEANKTVPHDEGNLERSGAVDSDGTTSAMSYDTPYARRQHEDLTLHHGGKGKAKWLETTLSAEADAVAAVAAHAIRSEVGI